MLSAHKRAARLQWYIVALGVCVWLGLIVSWRLISKRLQTVGTDQATQSRQINYTTAGATIPGIPVQQLEVSSAQTVPLADDSVTGANIAPNTITVKNLNPSVLDWLLGNLNLNVASLIDLLGIDNLTASLQALKTLPVLNGDIQLSDLSGSLAALLSADNPIPLGSITGDLIADGAIQTINLAAGSITAPLLADGSVHSAALALGSVLGSNIADGAVQTGDIADGAITTDLLASGAVTSTALASDAVGTANIAANAVTHALLASGAVQTDSITTGAITNALLANDSVGTANISDGAITNVLLADNAVTGNNILAGTISTDDIANGAITGALLAVGSVGTANIASNAITSALIAAGAVTTGSIAPGAITSGLIASGAVGTGQLASGSVTGSIIGAGAITASNIASGTITGGLLANGTVTTSQLSTAASKHTVSVQIGNVASALGSTFEVPIFVAPTGGTITKVTFTNSANIGISQGTASVQRLTAPTATVASISLAGVSLTAFSPNSPTLSGGTSFSAGDTYSFKYTQAFLGVALTGFLVTIEYTASG